MRKTWIALGTAAAAWALPLAVMAQQADGPDQGPGPGGPPNVAPEGRGPGQGGPGMQPGGPGNGPGGRMGGRMGQGMMPPNPFDKERAYLELVDRFSKLAHDPEAAGVAAVITANEIVRPKGTDAAIAYFTKLLPDVKSEAVKRAIRIHLIDLYRTSGQNDKALAEIEALIKAAPETKTP